MNPKSATPFDRGDKNAMMWSKKGRVILSLCAISFVSIAFFEELSNVSQRRLACVRTLTEEYSGNPDDIRHLSKFGEVVDRVLNLVSDESPCTTLFPDDVEEVVEDPGTAESAYPGMDEPDFDITTEDYFSDVDIADLDEVFILAPQDNDNNVVIDIDIAERNLITSFEPQIYDPIEADANASTNDSNTVAYIVPLVGCPDSYEPPVDGTSEPAVSSDLYEASAVLKCSVCETTEAAQTARRLGETRKLADLGDLPSAAEMEYSMHALIHPMATECPISEGSDVTYDRVKLLKSLNYRVEILGHPITETKLFEANQIHIKDNIESDIGIRDTIKLHAWSMTTHRVVVLMDYETMIDQPIDAEIDMLLASDSIGMYLHSKPDETTGAAGVDTGFMIIKPSEDEFNNIVDSYLNTPYDPVSGWDGQGYNNFKGGLGLSGFLAYYFANHSGYVPIDRCTYAHTADEDCLGTLPFQNRKATTMLKDVCGNPRNCPYSHPLWADDKKEACAQLHRQYFSYRNIFEEKYFSKENKQPRIGLFKQDSFLGYCTGPGQSNLLSMTGVVVPKADWQTICPIDACPDDSYMRPDCTCTDPFHPCSACPDGTTCQTYPTLMCIDCNCAFCDNYSSQCCEDNASIETSAGGNVCQAVPGRDPKCDMSSNFFPAFNGSSDICSSEIQLSRSTVPNGCGCKPTSHSPCNYSKDWGESSDKCFICTADDLAQGDCSECKSCMSGCANSSCLDTSVTTEQFMSCMDGITDTECRAQCHFHCMKN